MELFLKRSRRHGNTVALLLPLYLSSSDCLLKWSRRPSPLGVMGRGGIVCLQSFTLWCQALAATQNSRLYIPTWGVLPEILFMWNWNQMYHRWLTTIKDPEECEAFNHCDQIFDTGRRAVQSKSNIMHKCLNKKIDPSKCNKRFRTAAAALVSGWPNDHRQTAKSGLSQSISAPLYLCSDQLISASWTLTHVHVDMWTLWSISIKQGNWSLKPYLHIATLGINSSIELEVNVWMVAIPDVRADPPFSIHQALFYFYVGRNKIRIHSRTYVC